MRTRPAWKQLDHLGGRRAWAQRSATASGATRCGIYGRAHHESAHCDDLLSLPDLEGEGTGSPAKDVGAVLEGVERGNHAAAPDLDEASMEEVSRKLAGQLATLIVPGQEKGRSIQRLNKNFLKLCQLGFHLLSKIHLAKQLEHQKVLC